jgi:hypothetical protein
MNTAAEQTITVHRTSVNAAQPAPSSGPWTVEAIQALLDKPLLDLVYEARPCTASTGPRATSNLPRCCR